MQKPIRIAVNARFLIKNKLEGIGLFTYESLKRIVHLHPEVEFFFLFDREYDQGFVFNKNVRPVVLFPPARHPLLWFWWFEISVSRWLRKNQPDLFLSPDGYGCLSSNVPQVLVMHDLAYEHFADNVPFPIRYYLKYFMPRFASKASRIATVSSFSKNDIVQRYSISPELIDVVYNGAKEVYKPINETVAQHIRRKYARGSPYFICVSAIHPRKNITNLLRAFDQFKIETKSEFKLLLVGRKAWGFREVEQTHAGLVHKNDVIFLGHMPAEDLSVVVASAYAMVYVSLFEGFGIPIIEAMSCGVPVITSNVTSMPEAAGDAALLVNPHSVEEIAAAMKTLAQDHTLRNLLSEKSKVQAQKFSWDMTADKLWTSCRQVLEIA